MPLLDSFLRDLRRWGPPVIWRYTQGTWLKVSTDRYEITGEYVWLYQGQAKVMEILLGSTELEIRRKSYMEILLDPELKIQRKPRPDMLVVRCRACYAVNGFELFWPE